MDYLVQQASEKIFSSIMEHITYDNHHLYRNGNTFGVTNNPNIGDKLTINQLKKLLRFQVQRRLTLSNRVIAFNDLNIRAITFQHHNDHPALPEGVWLVTQG